jgi:hypothetical protein
LLPWLAPFFLACDEGDGSDVGDGGKSVCEDRDEGDGSDTGDAGKHQPENVNTL